MTREVTQAATTTAIDHSTRLATWAAANANALGMSCGTGNVRAQRHATSISGMNASALSLMVRPGLDGTTMARTRVVRDTASMPFKIEEESPGVTMPAQAAHAATRPIASSTSRKCDAMHPFRVMSQSVAM